MKQASDFDAAMRIQEDHLQNMQWLSAFEQPLRLQGFAWNTEDRIFRRMPPNTKGDIPEAVDYLATHSSGGQVHFKTNSNRVAIAVKVKNASSMVHMPATGQSGCDLYLKLGSSFTYVNSTKYDLQKNEYNILVFEDPQRDMREFILNMPLYEEVLDLHIGFDEDAEVEEPSTLAWDRPIIIYGTSITQGGCASRPGMSTPNILSRRLHCEWINLGFSGSGKGEPAMAHYVSQAHEDPSLIILDYEANTRPIGDTLPEFVEIIRSHHPQTPLLIISAPPNTKSLFKADVLQQANDENDYQRQLVEERRSKGDAHIHFLDGATAIRQQFAEATVDAIHPTDLGFLIMADHWEQKIRELLR